MDAHQTPHSSSKKMKPNSKVQRGSVDVYAAECKNCKKWRVIDSQEKFEEIRLKVGEQPFYCDQKANTSCKDPADIEYDATRTWVIDKPNLPKTPKGFRKSLVLRKDYSKMDPYYIAPTGKALRTRNEVAAFLKAHPEYSDVSLEEFVFSTPKIMEDTIPDDVVNKGSANSNKRTKLSKDEDGMQ